MGFLVLVPYSELKVITDFVHSPSADVFHTNGKKPNKPKTINQTKSFRELPGWSNERSKNSYTWHIFLLHYFKGCILLIFIQVHFPYISPFDLSIDLQDTDTSSYSMLHVWILSTNSIRRLPKVNRPSPGVDGATCSEYIHYHYLQPHEDSQWITGVPAVVYRNSCCWKTTRWAA